MLDTINSYAGLINFVLFATVLGLLIHLANLYRTALVDKYEAQVELLRKQMEILQSQDAVTARNHEAAVKLLERQLTFYKSMADMPENRRVVAIKTEYQQRLEELERELKLRDKLTEDMKSEIENVRTAAEIVSNDPSPTVALAAAVLENVIQTSVRLLLR